MIRVFAYEDGKIGYNCEDCDRTFTEDITERITDNCALDVDVICKECGELGVLYFIRCTEEYMAKELMAKIQGAKESRKG
jgi:hypothetical protein